MTGNVALDVAIGLTFTYVLYSLFATVLMEIIITAIGLRAWNLQFSIYRMLRDEATGPRGKKAPFRLIGFIFDVWSSFIIKFGANKSQIRSKKLVLFNSFYDKPSIKYLARGGLFSKPSYISSENFSKALIDSLQEHQNDASPSIRIQQGINAIDETYNKETKEHIQSLLNDANNDLQKFKYLLEQWYDDTQERAIGWFKRKTQLILLMLGMTIATSFNLNTIVLAKRLAVDKDARDKMVEMAIAYSETYERSGTPDATYKKKLDSLNATRKIIEKQLNDANTTIGLGNEKIYHFWEACFWNRLYCGFTGIFLTALAISLGAPFWFDLLNRFIKLRSAVSQPVTKASSQKRGSKENKVSPMDREG